MKKSNNKTPIFFYIGVALLCISLVVSHLTSGIFARYASYNSSSDSARVAKFDIGGNITSETAVIELSNFKPDSSETIILRVVNNSEVKVEYSFSVETLHNLPLEFYFSNNGSGTLDANENAQAEHTLTVTWPKEQNDSAFLSEIDVVTVVLNCNQID